MALHSALHWTYYQADEAGFRRTPVLLTGKDEAVLIDGGFTLSDGKAVAAAIRATGKTLTTIYVSQSDPDYYFGLGPIRHAFPDAKVLAAPTTVAAIEATVDGKLKTWGPQLRDNGPKSRGEVVLPTAFAGSSLDLEGSRIEIVEAEDLPNRRYLWVPELEAIFGGVLVFSGLHVWTADCVGAASLDSWIKNLEAMRARHPKIVVPAHATPGFRTDDSSLTYTRDYLTVFAEELGKAKGSATLIEAMSKHYPNSKGVSNLELGAKVATGELRWG